MAFFERNSDATGRDRLEHLCQIVDLSLKQFRKAGEALAEIRDLQLYRLTHDTFADFCRERWGISDTHASRLIAAHSFCELLGPTGDLIATEHQARNVRKLAPKQQAEVLDEIHAGTPVAMAIRKHLPIGKKSRGGLKPIRFRLPGCTLVIEPNRKFPGVEETISNLLKLLEHKQAG